MGIHKRRTRTHEPSIRAIYRRLRKAPRFYYGIVGVLFLGASYCHVAFVSSLFYATEDAFRSNQIRYTNLRAKQKEQPAKSPPGNDIESEQLSRLSVGAGTKEDMEESHNSDNRRSTTPPSYLPLAQHLKSVNYTRSRISLRDMVFGAQKRTYPDLQPTNNSDLFKCEQCSQNCKHLAFNIPHSDHGLQHAHLAIQIVTFYRFSSMVIFPCIDELHWVFLLNAAIQKFNPMFEMNCAVSSDKVAVDLMKKYDRRLLNGLEFVVYQPLKHGKLPKVDVLFSWRGLEEYDLDIIEEVFKEAHKEEIKATLVGNCPGYENAKLVETGVHTFSVRRPEVRRLNVRAFPFGFNKALRVFSLAGKQLLLYDTSTMRDGWQ